MKLYQSEYKSQQKSNKESLYMSEKIPRQPSMGIIHTGDSSLRILNNSDEALKQDDSRVETVKNQFVEHKEAVLAATRCDQCLKFDAEHKLRICICKQIHLSCKFQMEEIIMNTQVRENLLSCDRCNQRYQVYVSSQFDPQKFLQPSNLVTFGLLLIILWSLITMFILVMVKYRYLVYKSTLLFALLIIFGISLFWIITFSMCYIINKHVKLTISLLDYKIRLNNPNNKLIAEIDQI